MRTVDFSTVMFRFFQLAGLDRNAVTTANFQQARDFASNRLRQICGTEYWPDLIRVSDAPGENVAVDSEGVRTVPLPSAVSELLGVYDKDPRLTTRSRAIKYYLYSDGTETKAVLLENASPVFLEYTVKTADLFGDPYSASATYSVGAQIYFDTSLNSGGFTPTGTTLPSGNFYTCLVATAAGQTPVTTPSSWSRVEIPYFCGDYLARACLADYLRSEGQFEQGAVAEAHAEEIRTLEVDRVLRQQGQVRRPNVFTY